MDKHTYRQEVIEKLTKMDEQTRLKKLESIYSQLFRLEEWKAAKCIGVTVSQFPELDTSRIIKKAFDENKIVVVPKSHPKLKTMDFKQIKTNEDLEVGYANILEPIEKLQSFHKKEIDLLIVPGVVYRQDGYRIGFGGGFYDRFLADYKGLTVSIAFKEQMNQHFTINEYDLPVQMIVKDDEIIYTNQM